MKAAPFTYLRPDSLEAAFAALSGADGFAKFIAGGQTLGPMMNLRLAQPDTLIDISRLAELRETRDEGDLVVFGGGVTHAMIEDGLVPDPSRGLMARAAHSLAYRSVRNRGTLGGSLAHADPSAEWPTVLSALEAEIRICSPSGRKTLPIAELLVGPMTTSLGDDELIEAVAVRRLSESARWGYHKICRKAGEFANAMAAVVIAGGSAQAVLGALPSAPLALVGTCEVLQGASSWTPDTAEAARQAVTRDLDAADLQLTPYEMALHSTALLRAAREALEK